MLLLAQSLGSQPDSTLSYFAVGMVVIGLSSLVQLALAGKQLFGGNKGERQIEPTQLAGISSELKEQTRILHHQSHELGTIGASLVQTQREVGELRETHSRDINGVHKRIDGISRELASTTAKTDGLIDRENL
jgi:hypothetical protein